MSYVRIYVIRSSQIPVYIKCKEIETVVYIGITQTFAQTWHR